VHHKAPHRPSEPEPATNDDIGEIPIPATLDDDYSHRARADSEARMRISRDLTTEDLQAPVPTGLSAAEEVAGLAAGMVFLRRQGRLAEPFVPLQLFRIPAFAVSLGVNTHGLFLVSGAFFLTAQYLQLVAGLSPLASGLWSMPPAAGMITGSLLAPALTHRMGTAVTTASSLVIAAGGLTVLATLPGGGSSALAVLVTGSDLLALGVLLWSHSRPT
jgi:hypothetical protein